MCTNMKGKGTILIFSDLYWYGVKSVANILDIIGYQEVTSDDVKYYSDLTSFDEKMKNKTKNVKGRYSIWSGKIKQQDKESYSKNIREIFNSKYNAEGNYLQIILGTRSIMEGISFKNVKDVHIMNPWWNESRLQQVIARAIRFKSHVKLPPKDRFVNVYKHYSVFPSFPESYNTYALKKKKITEEKMSEELVDKKISNVTSKGFFRYTLDQHIGRRSKEKKKKSREFEMILKSSAVDCNLNINGNLVRLEENFIPIYNDNKKYQIYYENPTTGDTYLQKEGNEISNLNDYTNKITFDSDVDLYKCVRYSPNKDAKFYYLYKISEGDILKTKKDLIVNEGLNCEEFNDYNFENNFENKSKKEEKLLKLKQKTFDFKKKGVLMTQVLFPGNNTFIPEAGINSNRNKLLKFIENKCTENKDIKKKLEEFVGDGPSEKENAIRSYLVKSLYGYDDGKMYEYVFKNKEITDVVLTYEEKEIIKKAKEDVSQLIEFDTDIIKIL